MSFTLLKSPVVSLSVSALLLHHLLVFLPAAAAVAQRNDMFSPLSSGRQACDCCDVSLTSSCCLNCWQRAVVVVAGEGTGSSSDQENTAGDSAASSSSRFSRDESGNYVAEGTRDDDDLEEWRGWSDSAAAVSRACRCCRQVFSPSLAPGLPLTVGRACCSACHNRALLRAPVSGTGRGIPSALRLPSSSSSSSSSFLPDEDDVSGDTAREGMTSAVKRMTSMDCMCCMNSGISDCCSKCRIF